MGGCMSKAPVDEGSVLSQALERKLINAIITTKRRKSFKVKKSSFNNLMLQMPKLTAGFKKIREAHSAVTGGKATVPWSTFCQSCATALGLDGSSASLKELLDIPEVGPEVPVTHGDIIIMFTVLYLLDGSTKRRTIVAPEVRSCLELMEKSFMFFDSSADGCIERKELAVALKSGTRVFGRKASKSLADRLFDQLDWSKDGQITFCEYLIGMERIIIETAGDEGEEDDDLVGEEEEEEEEDELENMEPWDGKTPKSAVGGEGAKANKNIFKEMAVADKLAAANSSAGGDEVRPFSTSGMVATDHDIA
ncbi:hypothetical protein CHLRE_06g306750v5 [Chlamydomonas reinhardtii]|uniref:EF-hand domain-containing protein n=1 Tax=Chlamydomonas reinhardtii TaxID=3055 RepID=A0A2K3DRE3_CHLRE|nr:uncharacterized protein CHLRE_06g306750v5 [Chlamydomonas reinhardtii]PNW83106.1 hypothetical protein CHLRE_06g306750v5 [Chlamydomonas reinhardtii]